MAANDDDDLQLPKEPIDRIVGPLERFLHVEAASGFVLVAATLVALGLANSPWAESFLGFWETKVGVSLGGSEVAHSLKHWINDGLMAIFFFVIGLEVKREIVFGELGDLRAATLPIAAALGGMLVPAGIFLSLQAGTPSAAGWGVPMATDIAFVVGCLAVLGKRVPRQLRALLLSLAIADDIGAILVIAIAYTEQLDVVALATAGGILLLVFVCARLGIRSLMVYWILGFLTWVEFHASGVHATLAGVALGLMTPARRYAPTGLLAAVVERARNVLQGGQWDQQEHRGERIQQFRRVARESVAPLEYLEVLLHPWVAFGIMPLFALANAGVPLHAGDLVDPTALSVAAGLAIGKPVGIVLLSWITVRVGLSRLPEGLSWPVVLGGGCLAGIGFTMALFLASLALTSPELEAAKVGVLLGSVLAAAAGMGLLWRLPPRG